MERVGGWCDLIMKWRQEGILERMPVFGYYVKWTMPLAKAYPMCHLSGMGSPDHVWRMAAVCCVRRSGRQGTVTYLYSEQQRGLNIWSPNLTFQGIFLVFASDLPNSNGCSITGALHEAWRASLTWQGLLAVGLRHIGEIVNILFNLTCQC